MLSPGTRVDRYELVSPVGEGGMAQVWIARQRGKHGFEKLFAWKCIHPRFAEEPAFRAMFLDEARIAAAIEHPNVAQVFDLGESESMLYLVMEYVDGEALGAVMAAASRRLSGAACMPVGIALRIMADVCAGLQAAHTLRDEAGQLRGVVHRDVSPQNIIVSVRGDVKLIDFGIAHAKDRVSGDTAHGALKGKVHYMAPEQALRQPLGPFTDVFSTGATLYRLLAGRPPFDAGSDLATLQCLLSEAPPEPLPDSVPPLVAAIVERALARDPGDRYPSARAMQAALEAALADGRHVAHVGAWMVENMSEAAKERRAALAARRLETESTHTIAEPPSFVADLELPEERPRAASGREAARAEVELVAAAADRGWPLESDAIAALAPTIAPIRLATPASLPPSSTGPGMLDVRALVAERAGAPGFAAEHGAPAAVATAPTLRPALADAEPARGTGGTPAVSLAPRRHAEQAALPPATPAGARGKGWMTLSSIVMVLLLVVAGVLLLLPRLVRDRVIAAARDAGVELTIERVGVGFSGVSVRGVVARAASVPSATVRADEIFATSFSARELRVRGLDISLAGHARDVGPTLLAFYERHRGRLAGGAGEPRTLAIVAAHVGWVGVLGEGTRLEVAEISAETESRSAGAEEVRATVSRLELKTQKTTLGPWGATFDRSAAATRLRLLLDAPVSDGPSVLVVSGKAPTRVTVKIPRSPLARLGLRAEELGLPVDPGAELAVTLEGGLSPNQRVEGSGRLELFGARLRGVRSPVDVRLEGSASGAPGKALDLERTTLTLGPLAAGVNGTLTPNDLGFRVDATWRAAPVACEKLAHAEARALGPVALALQDLARTSGAARVTGTVNASGLVQYDTREPDHATLTVVTRETCGLAIFGL